MNLTEEQRRRIEENRRKALEKRAAAAKAASKTNSKASPLQTVSNNQFSFNKQQPQGTVFGGRSHSTIGEGASNTVQKTGDPRPFSSQPTTSSTTKPASTTSTNTATVASIPFYGKSITGICRLVSTDRFIADIGFQQQLISIFKSISGSQYDAQKKLWNFPLMEHQNLMKAVESLKPAVVLGPLPAYVSKLFKPNGFNKKSVSDADLNRIDPVLTSSLMPFQKDGVKFGISRDGRVLIADDMGLGKTIQALGVAHYYYQEWPLLISTPSSMRYAWREAIWNWLPSVPAGSIFVMETSKDLFQSAKVVIVSYDLLQRRIEELSEHNFKVVIMDESHHLKNFKTARTKAGTSLIQKSRRAILLSGTPALSRPIELFPQISSICRYLFNLNDFGVRYCAGKKNNWGWDYSGSSNMEELQLVLEATIMIRRLKSEVLQQLPQKLRRVVTLDPTSIKITSSSLRAKAKAFNEGKALKNMEARGRLLEYYAETSKVKIPAVCSYIKDLIESGKKFICFAHHRTMLDALCSTLEEIQCKYIRIDGATSPEDRQYAVDQFQSSEDVLVAVLSITAANSGITMTAACLVLFAELYWNPGILTQAEDRAHRIGQRDSVVVEYLIAKGTADDELWTMIKGKLDVLNQAGLSKDNFNEVDATSFMISAGQPKEKSIADYFVSSQVSGSQLEPSTTASNEAEMSELEDELLQQLIDESFGD